MPDGPRILITGSRNWACHDLAANVLAGLVRKHGPEIVIVHGDCETGVDHSFREMCEELGINQEPHPAHWLRNGNAAGVIRNREMVRLGAKVCLAFSRDLAKSKGTCDCVRRALAAHIPCWLVESETGEPRRITKV